MSDHHNFFFFLFLFVLFFECSYDCCVHTSSKEKQKASLCSVCVCVHILLISGHVYFLFCFADQKHGTVTKKPQLHPLLKTSLLCYRRKHFGIRADQFQHYVLSFYILPKGSLKTALLWKAQHGRFLFGKTLTSEKKKEEEEAGQKKISE